MIACNSDDGANNSAQKAIMFVIVDSGCMLSDGRTLPIINASVSLHLSLLTALSISMQMLFFGKIKLARGLVI